MSGIETSRKMIAYFLLHNWSTCSGVGHLCQFRLCAIQASVLVLSPAEKIGIQPLRTSRVSSIRTTRALEKADIIVA